MSNAFKGRALPLAGPATDMVPITPSDTADLPAVALALYAETGGTIVFTSAGGATRTVRVADFSMLPVGVRRVRATGTTASGLHAMVQA